MAGTARTVLCEPPPAGLTSTTATVCVVRYYTTGTRQPGPARPNFRICTWRHHRSPAHVMPDVSTSTPPRQRPLQQDLVTSQRVLVAGLCTYTPSKLVAVQYHCRNWMVVAFVWFPVNLSSFGSHKIKWQCAYFVCDQPECMHAKVLLSQNRISRNIIIAPAPRHLLLAAMLLGWCKGRPANGRPLALFPHRKKSVCTAS